MDDALRRRLRKLGIVQGLRGLRAAEADARDQAAQEREARASTVLPGRQVEAGGGTFWLAERAYPADVAHGRHRLAALADVTPTALELLDVPDLGPRPAFLDTETTGLAGGTGTLAFLIGVGIWQEDRLALHLIFMRDPAEEAAALSYLTDVLSQATGLVTFNGRGFDVPILESRYILNRMPPAPLALPHLDLLGVARTLWRDHLASRRLGELERHILDVVRTEQDIDSALIPWLYRQYLETGETGDIERVFYHNEIDVLSLASLLIHVSRMVEAPEALPLAPAEWAGVGRVYDRAGREDGALRAWRLAVSGELGELDDDCASRLWSELGTRYKRREAWKEALAVWDAWIAAMPLAVAPLVEKAKYFEWTVKDLEAALVCTERALKRAAALPAGMARYRALAELRHRQGRLERRLAGEAEAEADAERDVGGRGATGSPSTEEGN
ncbi:MAG: ribonuclease H-like domain-containing protein [Anaerolineae bacterium]